MGITNERMIDGYFRLISLFLLLAAAVLGQVNTASIVGTVTDATGGVVPGAEVTATHTDTGASQSVESDASGSYVFSQLPIGSYVLTATASGFKTTERSGIKLDATQRVKVDIQLEIGQVTENVTVTSAPPVVNTQNTELGVLIGERQVKQLPLNGRNFAQLISLEPGTTRSGGRTFFNGLTSDGVNITVDGTDASNPDRPSTSNFGGQTQQNILSVEFIAEFKTTTGTFSAETGRALAGGVNVITKSGTNEFHGGAYEFFRNDELDARNFFAAQRDKLRLNQFGANGGGPIVKNRAFFFFGWERVEEVRGQQVTGDVLSSSFREELLAANPELGPLLELQPTPTEPTDDPRIGFHRRSSANRNREDSFLLRLDARPLEKHHLFVSGRLLDSEASQVDLSPLNRRTFPSQDRSGTASWTWIMSPTVINEVRAGMNKQDIPRVDAAFVPRGIGNIDGFINTTGQELLRSNGGSWSLLDNLSYTTGKHSIKVGFEVRRFHNGRANFENPVYQVNSAEDLLAGRFDRVSITIGNDLTRIEEWDWGFYFQDDVRVTPTVTVNLGLRYEFFTSPKEKDDMLFNVVEDPFGPFRPRGEAIFNDDKNNWGPRGGVSWDIGGAGKNVIRAGGGVFYSPNSFREVTALVNPPDRPFRIQIFGPEVPDLRLPADEAAIIQDLSAFPAPTDRNTFDPNQRTSYSVQWSANYQRQLAKDLVAEIGYVGNRGLKLLDVQFLNERQPLGPAPGSNLEFARPNPDFGRVGFQSHSDMSVYHSLQASLRKRFSDGLQFNGHYTWGRAISIGGVDSITASGNDRLQNQIDNRRGSRGRTDFDIEHSFVFDYNWELPIESWFGTMSGLKRQLLAGWQILGITTIRSGETINVLSGFDNFGTGDAQAQRPDAVAGVESKVEGYDTSPDNQFLNPAAFADPCASRGFPRPCGLFGNLGKNTETGPSFINFDFSVFKNFRLTERVNLQWRTEFFNVFNNVNFNPPSGSRIRLSSANFGELTSAARPREIQFALKLTF